MEIALAYATDVERPAVALFRAMMAADDDEWLTNVNAYVEQFGIAPIRLEKTSAPRFFRLTTDAPPTVSSGPLVTVLMPAFNAERTLEIAATSILKQSWTELELIIVDDCSSDATWEIARTLADVDSRVRARRNNVNVGPYVSKNFALAMARGDYITCHDADDWAHPQRIEKQVQAIVAEGGRARACVASWLRLDETGGFCGFTTVGRQSHDGALRLAHVTCMIEAEFMKGYVGHWDSVRFGADGEMLERLERLLGDDLLRLRHLSVFSLDAPRSLTNHAVYGISKAAGLSPTRRAYRDAWRQWHATVTSDSAYIEFPQLRRPFAAPDACVVRAAEAELALANG
jgi:glycosyltransferase involved in cell wall biosynthesis